MQHKWHKTIFGILLILFWYKLPSLMNVYDDTFEWAIWMVTFLPLVGGGGALIVRGLNLDKG